MPLFAKIMAFTLIVNYNVFILKMLYFTDGEGTYPKKKPGYRTAFVFMKDYDETKVPAWAMRIRLDKSDR